MAPAEEEEDDGNSINMEGANFNMYFYF